MIPFTRSDVWVFLSIAAGDDGAALKDVLAAADSINHSPLSLDELRRGLAKLTAAGYVREDSGRFLLTLEGRALYESAGGGHLANLAVWDSLNASFGVSGASADPAALDDARWAYPGVSAKAFRGADAEYRREFWAAYRGDQGGR